MLEHSRKEVTNTFLEDTAVPMDKIERDWLRKIAVCLIAIPNLIGYLLSGLLFGTITWYESCSSIWRGDKLVRLVIKRNI